MSCLKNLLILFLVVGVLIYITQETKTNKESFSAVRNLLTGKKDLSSKQINSIDNELKSEESRDSLISKLNSEISSMETEEENIQPAQDETNYAVIGRVINKPKVLGESEENIRKVIGRQLIEEEEVGRKSSGITKQLQEEEEFKRYLFGKRSMSEEENPEEYNVVPFVEEETLQRVKTEAPEAVSKYVQINEERQNIEEQKRYLLDEANQEEEMLNRKKASIIAEEEAIYDRRMHELSRQRRAKALAEEEQKARIYAEEEQRAKYLLAEEEEAARYEAQEEAIADERARAKAKAKKERRKYLAQEEAIAEERYLIQEEAIAERKAREKELARKRYLAQEEAIAQEQAIDKQRYLAQEEAIAQEQAIDKQRYLAQEEAIADEKNRERKKAIALAEAVAEEEELEKRRNEEASRNEEAKRKKREKEERILRKKYLEDEEKLAKKKAKQKAMKKQKEVYIKDEQSCQNGDYTYLDEDLLMKTKLINGDSLDDMKKRHKNQIKCGTFIEPEYQERINGFAWKNILDEKDYHPFDPNNAPEEPESIRDIYNSMIPKLNEGKNPHKYLNTHGPNKGTTMKTCSNGYSIYDENAKHKNKTGGVYSMDICFDPHSNIN